MPVQASTSRHTANTETAILPTTPPDTLHVSSPAERQAEASMTLDSLSRALQQGMCWSSRSCHWMASTRCAFTTATAFPI